MNAKGWKCCVSLELNLDLVGCIEIDSIAVPLFTNIRRQDPKNYADSETLRHNPCQWQRTRKYQIFLLKKYKVYGTLTLLVAPVWLVLYVEICYTYVCPWMFSTLVQRILSFWSAWPHIFTFTTPILLLNARDRKCQCTTLQPFQTLLLLSWAFNLVWLFIS